jgi:HNH endonuclease
MSKTYKAGAVAGELDQDGYVVIELDGTEYYAHDLAWKMTYGVDPRSPLEHINGNRSDNRIANLRETLPL